MKHLLIIPLLLTGCSATYLSQTSPNGTKTTFYHSGDVGLEANPMTAEHNANLLGTLTGGVGTSTNVIYNETTRPGSIEFSFPDGGTFKLEGPVSYSQPIEKRGNFINRLYRSFQVGKTLRKMVDGLMGANDNAAATDQADIAAGTAEKAIESTTEVDTFVPSP